MHAAAGQGRVHAPQGVSSRKTKPEIVIESELVFGIQAAHALKRLAPDETGGLADEAFALQANPIKISYGIRVNPVASIVDPPGIPVNAGLFRILPQVSNSGRDRAAFIKIVGIQKSQNLP